MLAVPLRPSTRDLSLLLETAKCGTRFLTSVSTPQHFAPPYCAHRKLLLMLPYFHLFSIGKNTKIIRTAKLFGDFDVIYGKTVEDVCNCEEIQSIFTTRCYEYCIAIVQTRRSLQHYPLSLQNSNSIGNAVCLCTNHYCKPCQCRQSGYHHSRNCPLPY